MRKPLILLFFIFQNVEAEKFVEIFQIGDRKYVEIEAVHLIDTPLGIQIVHAVVPLSSIPVDQASKSQSQSVWYIPEQEQLPKLAYLTSHGWFFLSELDFHRIQPNRRGITKKAPQNAQLDVTSLLRLAPSSFKDTNFQFIKKGSIGAYVYSELDKEKPSQNSLSRSISSASSSTAQIIQSGNLAAYIYSESDPPASTSPESLFWLIPAISHQNTKSYTTRLHDGSLLMYTGSPKLIKMKV